MVRALTEQEHNDIANAIRSAESRTSGEIYCVLARSSGNYFFVAGFIAAISVLLAGLAAALVLEHWWISVRLPWFAAAQLLAVACALLLLWLAPSLRIALVPHSVRFRHAHDNALKQFLARNVHLTAERTGVLLFVSIEERFAEVVADSGINAKVPQETWNAVVAGLVAAAREDRLARGFVEAVTAVGDLLAAHFPVRDDDTNELDDHLVEI